MPNWLDVNPRSGVPLYVQLMQQITHALEIGILHAGDQLPTVRQLASELTIAPNTIVKAYDELSALGLIESRQGVGTLVTTNMRGVLRQHQQTALFEQMAVLVRDAANLGISEQELRNHFERELARFHCGQQDKQMENIDDKNAGIIPGQ
ncbi:MAG TPA: GntR family transcriptional regulator [Ktedonobacteraceae bacterium]|nr:GntR family transcriptional regulator [Ktedonobacteraceae bacterium]